MYGEPQTKQTFSAEFKQNVVEEFSKRISRSVEVRQDWLNKEVIQGYAMYESGGETGQWTTEDWEYQRKREDKCVEINRCNPIIRSINGFEIQNRMQVTFSPRDTENEQFAELAENGYKYVYKNARLKHINAHASKDVKICGVGYVHHYLSYDKDLNGDTEGCRVFPGFVFYDPSARAKNLKDANWFSVVSIRDSLVEGEDDEDEEEGVHASDSTTTNSGDDQILQFFNLDERGRENIRVEHDYQWRQKEPVYRIMNPLIAKDENGKLLEDEAGQLIMRPDLASMQEQLATFGADPEPLMQHIGAMFQQFKLNTANPVWYFDKADWRKFKQQINELNQLLVPMGILPIDTGKPVKQKKYVYYRAEICRGVLKEISRNVSQEQFAIQAMTGEYSESDQMFYGLMRMMANPQRFLNQTLSDIQAYIRTNPKGGILVEAGRAVDDADAFVDSYIKGDLVTPVKDGALGSTGQGAAIMPKPVSQMPQGLLDLISYYGDAIMLAAGVTPEFMGQLTTKDMTGLLQAQIVRQTLTTLTEYTDGFSQFLHDQARLIVDFLRVMAENENGRMLPFVGGDGKKFSLLQDPLKAKYDVEISEVPETPNERQIMFHKLLEFQMELLKTGVQANLMPIALEYSDLPQTTKQQMLQAMTPPPPPEPDPIQVDLVVAQTNDLNAGAQKKSAEAAQIQQKLSVTGLQALGDLASTRADTDLTKAQTIETLANAGAKHDAGKSASI